MKNRFLFLLPRLAALTLIAGIASLLLGFIFKLLLAVVVLGTFGVGIATIVKKIKRSKNEWTPGLPPHNRSYNTHHNYSTTTRQTIVPIN